jgi:2-oxoglutarate dehydrogenase E2 component (dihydrolipoamide succinyltransferase)
MATDVKIPSLGESISSGVLSKWLVKDGDYVNAGQPIFELETDKVTSEGTAEASGVIRLKASPGEEVAIGAVVATIDTSASKPAASAEKAEPAKTVAVAAPVATTNEAQQSPAVKRIAAETGINPQEIEGSGKGGRVTKGDMLEASQGRDGAVAKPAAASVVRPAAGVRRERKKMTPLRRKIAERLLMSQQQAALLTTFNEVDMSPVMNIRNKYKDKFFEKHGVKLGFMSFFVKAVVKALKEIKSLNSMIDGDEVIENNFFDIGVAVGSDKGLFVPVVRECDQKNLAQIEADIVQYAKKARDGKITIDDMQGGVFTITNGGTYGSMLSTPIINPPQSGILGMHAIKDRAVVVNGEVVVRPIMYIALTYDHRLVDGKDAVTFLVKVKEALEDPTVFLLDL